MTILDLAQQVGIKPKWVASTNGGEYHSLCPICGGKDRFYIQPFRQMSKCQGSYCCRQCGIKGDSIQFARQFLHYSFEEALDVVNAINLNTSSSFTLNKYNTQQIATLIEPPAQWILQATHFINQAHKQLLTKSKIIESLIKRGIPLNTIQRYKFGWSETNQSLSKASWGLPEKLTDNTKNILWIPKGLVIPIQKPTGEIIRIKIRRDQYLNDKLPKYVAISGSMNGLSIIGNIHHDIMIVVESELDAYAIEHVMSDVAFTVAVGSNSKNPDNVTDYYAKRVKKLLICHDNDEAGKKMFIKWCKLYPHAQSHPTPIGKDIGEAIQQGFDIKNWLLKIIQH